MDMLTPARTWGTAPKPADHEEHDHAMAWPQKIAMLCTVIVPFLGLIAAIFLMWHREHGILGIGWGEIIVMIVMYSIAGFGVTVGYHRLLTHKSFDCPRWVRLMLSIFGSSAAQGMTIRWVATHRRHHQLSDLEGDPHSPHVHGFDGFKGLVVGLWHAHIGWTFDADRPDLVRSVQDLMADKAMLLIDQLYLLWVALGIFIPAVALGLYEQSWLGFAAGMIWGGLLRIFLMLHVTWSINSVCHVFGTSPFRSGDHSRNNFPIALVSLGEGWHNNHHAFPTSARHGLRWWQFDSSYIVIKTMGLLGMASNIRVPNEMAMNAKLKKPSADVQLQPIPAAIQPTADQF